MPNDFAGACEEALKSGLKAGLFTYAVLMMFESSVPEPEPNAPADDVRHFIGHTDKIPRWLKNRYTTLGCKDPVPMGSKSAGPPVSQGLIRILCTIGSEIHGVLRTSDAHRTYLHPTNPPPVSTQFYCTAAVDPTDPSVRTSACWSTTTQHGYWKCVDNIPAIAEVEPTL